LIAMSYWRRSDRFLDHAYTANAVTMTAGFMLMGYHVVGFFVS